MLTMDPVSSTREDFDADDDASWLESDLASWGDDGDDLDDDELSGTSYVHSIYDRIISKEIDPSTLDDDTIEALAWEKVLNQVESSGSGEAGLQYFEAPVKRRKIGCVLPTWMVVFFTTIMSLLLFGAIRELRRIQRLIAEG